MKAKHMNGGGARAYVRVSTLKSSQKDSPEHQEGVIRETAASEGVDIEHVYTDRGTATSIIDRDDVKQMVNDAKNGDFKTIYFAALSRFSRDTLDALSLKRILVNALGIRVVSIEDLYDSAKEDNEMIFTMISAVNQKQSETISKSSKRGKRQAAKKGNITSSIAPIGYKKCVLPDGRKSYEIDPQYADLVRLVFELYTEKGYGEKLIVGYLNDPENDIIPSPKAGSWGLTTIQRMLQNESYTGYYIFGKLETEQVYEDIDDLQNRSKKLRLKEKSEWERTDKPTHPAIISIEQFQEAERIRLERGGGKRGGRRSFVNVFAKMVFCKTCNSAMVVAASKNRGKRYSYLICSRHRRHGNAGCNNDIWLPYEGFRDELIAGIIERMERVVNFDNAASGIAAHTKFTTSEDQTSIQRELKVLESKVGDNRKLLFEIRKQHMLGQISDKQYNFEKTQYEADIGELEKSIQSLLRKKQRQRDVERLRKDVEVAIKKISAITSYEDVELTRITLSKLIERVEISQDGVADVYTVLGQV